METLQNFEFDSCTIRQAVYESNLHMPPHHDEESRISIILDGTLIEKADSRFIEAKRNSVVIKPNSTLHENIFGLRGLRLLSISFRNGFSLPEDLSKWEWFEDPRVGFNAYNILYSIKSVKTDKELHGYLNNFVKTITLLRKNAKTKPPVWLNDVINLLQRYSSDNETIENIADRLKLTRVHISRSCRKFHSITPVQYRHYVRLNDLLYHLTCTNKSLAQVSYHCGFTDQSQMSCIVLKETGLTPRALTMLLQKD